MSAKPRFLVFGGLALAMLLAGTASAGDLRLNLPKRTQPTPVQKLNRQGVRALEKHDYAKAKALFYKAYLLDPNDPFTLNNLGYIAELDGEVERAQRFYALVLGYDPRIFKAVVCSLSAISASEHLGSDSCPSKSTKKWYCQGVPLMGRDSIFVRFNPLSASSAKALQSEPGT
jgi:tetratricopeptide (TPR) repeat protein